MARLGRVKQIIASFNTIDELSSFRLNCRDCNKKISIYDSVLMPCHDKDSPVGVGIVAPHEFLELEQRDGRGDGC